MAGYALLEGLGAGKHMRSKLDAANEAAAAKLAEAGDEAEASTAARQAQAAGSADDAAAWLAERGIHPPEKKLQLEQ